MAEFWNPTGPASGPGAVEGGGAHVRLDRLPGDPQRPTDADRGQVTGVQELARRGPTGPVWALSWSWITASSGDHRGGHPYSDHFRSGASVHRQPANPTPEPQPGTDAPRSSRPGPWDAPSPSLPAADARATRSTRGALTRRSRRPTPMNTKNPVPAGRIEAIRRGPGHKAEPTDSGLHGRTAASPLQRVGQMRHPKQQRSGQRSVTWG